MKCLIVSLAASAVLLISGASFAGHGGAGKSPSSSDFALAAERHQSDADLVTAPIRSEAQLSHFEANEYSRANPDEAFPLQPTIKGQASTGSPAFLQARDASHRVFDRVPVDVTKGARVIVVGHPYCHFTRNAVAAIDEQPKLSEAIGKVAMFIMPPRRTLDSTEAEDWNKAHPREAMHLVERKTDWPMVDSWDTPTFYFLRDGRVVTKVTGWPRGGHMSELLAGLASIGVKVSVEP